MNRYDGISRLKSQMDKHTQDITRKPNNLDFGTILPGFMLKTTSFSIPIPPNGWSVCRSLTVGKVGETFSGEIKIPAKISSLKVGDNVLVAWVGEGTTVDAVVIDIILPGTEVAK